MVQKKNIVRYGSGLLAVLFLIFCVPVFSYGASSNEQKTIRVAYPIQPGISQVDENGKYSGYTYEYLMEIAQYTGWTYEFVQVPGTLDEQLVTLMEMVKNGEVDLMGAILYSEAMTEQYDYSASGYGNVETVLKTLVNGGSNVVIDASRMQTLRIAAMATTGRQIDDLNEYCKMNLIEPVLIKCDNEAQLLQSLQDGRADVLLDSSMNFNEDLRTIASFSPRQFYFITKSNNNSGLLGKLNEAMLHVAQMDPFFQNSLYTKYFTTQSRELLLTDEEKAYIQKSGEFRVGVLNNLPPFQYKDKKKDELKGISVELLRYISEETGLKFTLVEADSLERLYQMAEKKEIDLIAGMPYDYTIAEEKKLSMTRPYTTGQYILLLNERISEDQIKGKRLALWKSGAYYADSEEKAETYDTLDECIRVVNSGKADYTYVDSYTAQYYMNLPEFDKLRMVPQSFQVSRTCFGIVDSNNHILFKVLNKAILAMSPNELQSIVYMNTVSKESFSMGQFIKKNPVTVLLLLGGVFALVLFALLVFLRQRAKSVKAISFELQKHMRLFAVSNDSLFEYDYKNKDLMIRIPEKETEHPQSVIHYDLHALRKSEQGREGQRSLQVLLELLNSNQNCVCEKKLFTQRDNQWHWFKIVLETICDDDSGEPVYAIGKITLIDKERTEKDELRSKAQRDSLTHLYNTESSRIKIEKKLACAPAHRQAYSAILLVDIDRFKSVNDTYGHMRGDEALCSIADFLQKSFSQEDVVGRLGGDEFIVYLSSVKNLESLQEKCEALCYGVRQIPLSTQQHLSVSVGAVLLRTSGLKFAALYRMVDKALYAAKSAGRDQCKILCEESMTKEEWEQL